VVKTDRCNGRFFLRVLELLLAQFVVVLPRGSKVLKKTAIRDTHRCANGESLPIWDGLSHFSIVS